VLPYHTLWFALLPNRDIEMATADLNRRRAGHVGGVEVVERLPPEVQSSLFEQCRRESLLQRLVADVTNHAVQLRIAVSRLGVDGCCVQAKARVARQVPELGGVRHAHKPQLIFEDPRLHRTDPREPVRAESGEQAQVVCGGMAAGKDRRDPRRACGELCPRSHRGDATTGRLLVGRMRTAGCSATAWSLDTTGGMALAPRRDRGGPPVERQRTFAVCSRGSSCGTVCPVRISGASPWQGLGQTPKVKVISLVGSAKGVKPTFA
jgi:hypothetical protein